MLRLIKPNSISKYFMGTASKKFRNKTSVVDESPDVYQEYAKKAQNDTILRNFRKEVFRRSDVDQELRSLEEDLDKKQEGLQRMLKNGNKDEILKRANQIGERFINNKDIYDQNSQRSLLSDYGNYASYNAVYADIQDRNLGEEEFLDSDNQIHANFYKFIDRLPNQYQEKEEVAKKMRSRDQNFGDMSISDLGKQLQEQADFANMFQEGRRVDDHLYSFNKSRILQQPGTESHEYTGIDKTVDPDDYGNGINGTLSPDAITTIYELYIQGWNVREISKRYGILPNRTKFCIWSRAQLYHEVLPKLGVKYFIECTRRMFEFQESASFCDYGLDLDDLNSEGILDSINEWSPKMLDAQRKREDYDFALRKLQEKKKFDRYEMVEVGTHGTENKMYKLKEWHIYRGKGSDDYFLKNTTFRKLSKAHRKFNKVYY